MTSLKQRLEDLRRRLPWLDHTLKMLGHYGSVNGSGQAGAVTYFGFLSVFPILALAVFVVGIVANVYPDIRAQMSSEINNLLPGVLKSRTNKTGIDLDTIGSFSGLAGIVGLLGVVYAGLGWLSGLRQALEVMFVVPKREQPNFVFGKLRDLLTLGIIGLTLMVSVVLSSAVTGFSGAILGWVGIDEKALLPHIGLSVLGHALAIAASMVLLLIMFELLAEAHVPRSALVRGALIGAVGFEILKSAANLLLASTKNQPAFQAFGVALILVVWINYFSRLVMYSAAWAYTSQAALDRRTAEATRAPGAALAEAGIPDDAPVPVGSPAAVGAAADRSPLLAVAAGSAALGGVLAWLARGVRR